MTTDVLAPEALVDLERYPVLDLDSPVARAVVAEARVQLERTGAVELAGFVNPEGLAALVADAEALAPRAHHSGGQGTAYLEFPDFSLPPDHPRLHFADYARTGRRLRRDPPRLAPPPPLRVGLRCATWWRPCSAGGRSTATRTPSARSTSR